MVGISDNDLDQDLSGLTFGASYSVRGEGSFSPSIALSNNLNCCASSLPKNR